ncbi:MAG: DeoR family transcriptional regulator [bacterium]|nr:DeoR family transcriptional regulator [bacterium]
MNNTITKIQKITNSLYDLADPLPETEPLKFKIKEKALEIFEKLILLEGSYAELKTNELEKKCNDILNEIVLMRQYLEFSENFNFLDKGLLDNLKEAYSRLFGYVSGVIKSQEVVERKSRIKKLLDLFKKEKELKTNDITRAMGNLSERTIRRDLNFLLEKGVIEKIGDKKITKYVFLSPGRLSDI